MLKTNPVENLEVPSVRKSMPRYLTLEESLELLTHVDPASPSYERDFCIVTLFLNCGMRLSSWSASTSMTSATTRSSCSAKATRNA